MPPSAEKLLKQNNSNSRAPWLGWVWKKVACVMALFLADGQVANINHGTFQQEGWNLDLAIQPDSTRSQATQSQSGLLQLAPAILLAQIQAAP